MAAAVMSGLHNYAGACLQADQSDPLCAEVQEFLENSQVITATTATTSTTTTSTATTTTTSTAPSICEGAATVEVATFLGGGGYVPGGSAQVSSFIASFYEFAFCRYQVPPSVTHCARDTRSAKPGSGTVGAVDGAVRLQVLLREVKGCLAGSRDVAESPIRAQISLNPFVREL